MLARAVLVWVLLLVVAVANGAARDVLLAPRLGDTAARALSSILISAAILLVTAGALRWIGPPSARAAWGVGLLWLGLTLAFELLAGHYALGTSWSALLADYDVRRGRIWVVVLLVTLLAPRLVHALRGE